MFICKRSVGSSVASAACRPLRYAPLLAALRFAGTPELTTKTDRAACM